MNIEFERTVQDIIDFNLFHLAHSSNGKKQVLLMRWLTGVLIIPLSISVIYLIDRSIDAFACVVSILASILAFVILPSLNRKLTSNRIKAMLSEGNNRVLLGHQSISLSPEGIFIKTQTTESKMMWSAIDKVVESDKQIYLYTSSLNALVIPKNCFQSEKEKKDFVEYVNQHRQQT